ACRRASWGRGRRSAWICGRAWRWRWSAISMARPAGRPSPRSCWGSWRGGAGRGGGGGGGGARASWNRGCPRKAWRAGGRSLIGCGPSGGSAAAPAGRAGEGRDGRGHRIVQEWGWLGKTETGDRLYVRRVTKHLPGGQAIGVVTDLLDEARYPAEA